MKQERNHIHAADFRRIAFIGAGGKTTLSESLAQIFAARESRVALTTTTHFFMPESMPVLIEPEVREIEAAWQMHRLIAVCGQAVETERSAPRMKMCAPGADTLRFLLDHASRLVMEADGARGMLLKLHGENEPVVPDGTELVYIVAGMRALGQPLSSVCHRQARIESVLHKDGCMRTTCDDIADVIGAVDCSRFPKVCAVLNRVTNESDAQKISDRLWEKYRMDSVWIPEWEDEATRRDGIAARLIGSAAMRR